MHFLIKVLQVFAIGDLKVGDLVAIPELQHFTLLTCPGEDGLFTCTVDSSTCLIKQENLSDGLGEYLNGLPVSKICELTPTQHTMTLQCQKSEGDFIVEPVPVDGVRCLTMPKLQFFTNHDLSYRITVPLRFVFVRKEYLGLILGEDGLLCANNLEEGTFIQPGTEKVKVLNSQNHEEVKDLPLAACLFFCDLQVEPFTEFMVLGYTKGMKTCKIIGIEDDTTTSRSQEELAGEDLGSKDDTHQQTQTSDGMNHSRSGHSTESEDSSTASFHTAVSRWSDEVEVEVFFDAYETLPSNELTGAPGSDD